jgi:hypothetical protein
MGDDVNGARMSGVEGERATRYLFGTTILAVLLEGDVLLSPRCRFPVRVID